MRRSRWLPLLVVAAAAALGATVAGSSASPVSAAILVVETPAEDPFPIRRVRVTEAQLPELIKTLEPDTLVRLPRAEFESRVKKAAAAVIAAKVVPRVVEAIYTAALTGDDLTGTAEWVIVNPCGRPAALSLDPLKLPLDRAKWADGTYAVIGAFGPGFPAGPVAWVEGTGRQVLRANWSAAATAEPGQRRFVLSVPAAPVAVLDLTLPAGHTPGATAGDAMLTGPFPVPGDDRRWWRVRFGGRSKLDLTVRGPGLSGGAGLVQATLAARYDLAPGQTTCTFEYDMQLARGRVAEWVFDADPTLRVTDVVVNNRDGWRVEPGPKAGGEQRLRVTLREPGAGGKVLVTAVAPPPDGPLPIVRPEGLVVIDEERFELRLHPELKPEDWRPGDYRLTESVVGPDGIRTMALVGTLLPTGSNRPFRRPPQVRAAASGPVFAANEAVEWRLDGGRQTVTVRVGLRVRRGPLFQFTLLAPPGFAIDRPAAPDDLIGYTTSAPGAGGANVVTVEFSRPLLTGQQAELRFDLRGPAIAAGRPVRLPFPRVESEGAAERDGWLAVCPGAGWSAVPEPNPAADELTEFDAPEPAPPDDAVATYPYRGKGPDGTLVLTPVRPVFDAETEARIATTGHRVLATSRLVLRVRSGAVSSVVVFEPGPFRGGREWRSVGDAAGPVTASPVWLGDLPAALPLFASPTGVLPAAVGARAGFAFGPGTFWVVRLARPATGEVVLETTALVAEFPGGPDPASVPQLVAGTDVPLLTVGGTASQSAVVRLDPGLAARVSVSPAADRYDTRSPVRVALRMRSRAAPPSTLAGAWSFGPVDVVTTPTLDDTEVTFACEVTGAGGARLPVRLPVGAEVRSVWLGGRQLGSGEFRTTERDGRPELAVPLPGSLPARVEVRYRLAARGGRVVSPAPELPGDAAEVRRWWVFPAGVLPVWPLRSWDAVRLAEVPGGPPNTGPGEPHAARLVGEEVVVVRCRVADATGFVLAALVAVAGWVGVRTSERPGSPRPSSRPAPDGRDEPGRSPLPRSPLVAVAFVWVVLAAAGLAVPLGPPGWDGPALPPLVASLLAAAALAVARGLRAVASPTRGAKVGAGAAVGLLLVGLVPVTSSRAQPTAPATVYILTATADAPEAVLAPRAVLDQLDALLTPPRPTAVVTAAEYDGTADDAIARFVARFAVFSFRDGETPVTLPLADARLERVTVGGKPAYPENPRPDVIVVPVPGPGRHEVEVRFAVPVGRNGPDREVRFGVPEMPAARLTFLAPPSARQPQATGWHGAQQVVPGKDGTRVRADVGGGRAVQVRWREAFTGPPVVKVREAAVWDVSEADVNLTACYLVRVEQGAVSRLQFDLPDELEPTRVAVRQQDAAGGAAAALRDWSLGPARDRLRRLRLDFQAAAGGRLLVVIESSPRTAPTRQPHLRFPHPIGMTPEADPVYGLRASRVGVDDDVPHTAVVAADAAALAPFNAVSDLRLDPAVPVRVFRPQGRGTPELRPVLRAGPEPPTITQDVTWRVGVGRADGEGAIRWKDAAPSVLEFQLPGSVRVVEVRGPDVAGWSATGGRVQVWFRRSLKTGVVEWVGTFAAPGKGSPDSAAFDPPVPRVTGARPGTESVRVIPADGVAVEIGPAPGWTVTHAAGCRGWSLRAEGSPAPPRFHLFATRPAGPARGFALVEPGSDGVRYRGVVQVPVRPGRPHHLVVSVVGLPAGAAADLEAPPGTRVTVRTDEGSARAWDLEVPASEAAVFRAAVAVKLPAGAVQLPAVAAGVGGEPSDPDGVVRLVGVTGRDRSVPLARASPAPPAVLDRVRKDWPAESDRLRVAGGSVWAVAAGSPPPRLVVGVAPGSAAEAGPAATAAPEPTAHAASADHGPDRWVSGLAAGWLLPVVGLAALAGLFPRTTWPEQLGLLGALFGMAVAGGWWVGLAAELFARLAWLTRAMLGASPSGRSG